MDHILQDRVSFDNTEAVEVIMVAQKKHKTVFRFASTTQSLT